MNKAIILLVNTNLKKHGRKNNTVLGDGKDVTLLQNLTEKILEKYTPYQKTQRTTIVGNFLQFLSVPNLFISLKILRFLHQKVYTDL